MEYSAIVTSVILLKIDPECITILPLLSDLTQYLFLQILLVYSEILL